MRPYRVEKNSYTDEVVDGEAAWAPPNNNCETYFILISTFRKKKSSSIKVSPFKCALSQEVKIKKKNKKKIKKMRPYSGVTAGGDGVGQLPGRS